MKRFVRPLTFVVVLYSAAFLLAANHQAPAALAPEQDESAESEPPGDSADAEGRAEEEKSPANEEKKSSTAKTDEVKPKDSDDSEKAGDESKAKSDADVGKKTDAKKRKTYKVEPKRLKVDVTLDGTFLARTMNEVPLRPETWSTYEIVEVVEHGATVRKGETLIKFDSEKIDDSIEDLELEQHLSELAIMKAEEELPRMEKTLRLDFEEAERANERAKEDFERYKEIERPMAVKSAQFMVKYYNFMLDYEQDELDQLEKMYEADDLTEETEEIVLKRQRNSVEFAEFSLESARISSDEILKVRIPRADIRIKEALERTALGLARARTDLSLDLTNARYKLEQLKKARAKSLEKHANLLADRALMEIKAPADGIVFYGQNVSGRWSDTQTLINKYKPHSNITPGTVIMSIVERRPISVTSTLEEGKRPDVEDGQKAKIILPAEGSDRVDGDVESISSIPTSPGKFEINFELEQDEIPDWVVPGMSCKAQITTYNKKDALVVPKTAVHADEDDEDQKYVWLVDPDDDEAEPERRNVKLGKRKGDEIEIVKGLKKGDVVSLDDEDKKKES